MDHTRSLVLAGAALVVLVGVAAVANAEDPRPTPEAEDPAPVDAGGLAVASPRPDVLEEPCVPHPPIRIEDDEDLGRPGSGVVAGLGTPEAPYIIAGWCIDGEAEAFDELGVAPEQGIGIWIADTESHVVVERNVVSNHEQSGIVAHRVENLVVRDNTVRGNGASFIDQGIGVLQAQHTAIRDNRIVANSDGLAVNADHTVVASGNHVEANALDGIKVVGARVHANAVVDNGNDGLRVGNGADVRDNTVVGNERDGVRTFGIVEPVTIAANTVEANGADGMRLRADGALVEQNTVRGNGANGVHVELGDLNVIRDNVVASNAQDGVLVEGLAGFSFPAGEENEVRGNVVEDNAWSGIHVDGGVATEVRRNAVADNDVGLTVDGESTQTAVWRNNIDDNEAYGLVAANLPNAVDVTHNWWSDASGPGGGVTDACTGEAAEGVGQAIYAQDAGVCFDPWLTSPSPSAG